MSVQKNNNKLRVQNISCILPESHRQCGLFLGNIHGANNANILKQYGIRAVLTTSIQTKTHYNSIDIPFHKTIQAHDKSDYNIKDHLEECFKFINQSIQFTNVFVHCYAGVSRSSTIIIAYLMLKFKWDLNISLDFVKSKRIVAKPNDGFMKQLKQYQNQLFNTKKYHQNNQKVNSKNHALQTNKNYQNQYQKIKINYSDQYNSNEGKNKNNQLSKPRAIQKKQEQYYHQNAEIKERDIDLKKTTNQIQKNISQISSNHDTHLMNQRKQQQYYQQQQNKNKRLLQHNRNQGQETREQNRRLFQQQSKRIPFKTDINSLNNKNSKTKIYNQIPIPKIMSTSRDKSSHYAQQTANNLRKIQPQQHIIHGEINEYGSYRPVQNARIPIVGNINKITDGQRFNRSDGFSRILYGKNRQDNTKSTSRCLIRPKDLPGYKKY